MNRIAIFSIFSSVFLALIMTQYGFGDIRYYLLGIALASGVTIFDRSQKDNVPHWPEVKYFIVKVLFKSPATIIAILGVFIYHGNILHIFQWSLGGYLVYSMILMVQNSYKGEEE